MSDFNSTETLSAKYSLIHPTTAYLSSGDGDCV